jgi:hypothetical protein
MVIVTTTAPVADGTASRIGTVGDLGDLIRIKPSLAILPRGPEPRAGEVVAKAKMRTFAQPNGPNVHFDQTATVVAIVVAIP